MEPVMGKIKNFVSTGCQLSRGKSPSPLTASALERIKKFCNNQWKIDLPAKAGLLDLYEIGSDAT